MALQRGFVLLSQQSRALLWKNALLAWRNIRSTLLRLFSPLFFFFLLFSAHKANQSWSSNRPQRSSSSVASRSFESLASLPIPSCDETFRRRSRQNLDGGCYDFVWSGNSSRVIRTIVDRIMASNPGREIPADKVLSFSTEEAANDWLIRGNNGMLSQVAVHFRERNSSFISYGFQFHPDIMRDATRHGNEDLAFKVLLPLQFAAEREMARSLSRVPNLGWQVGISEYPHPQPDEDIHQDDMATVGSFSGDDDHTTLNPFAVAASVDTDTLTPLFLLVISVFGIVGQMSSLVMEKELKLRQAMTIMGLYETAYWLSWVAWDGVVTSLSSLLIVLFGLMFKFNIFLHNSFMIWFLLLFLFQMSMTTFAFAISAFVNKSSSTTAAGFYVFIFGFICLIVTEAASMYDNIKVTSIYRFIWSLFPPNSLGGALFLLMDADGITWDDRSKCVSDSKCLVSINYFYEMLILSFFIWLLLAIYFDNILPNPYGVRKSVFYFLNPKYYIGKEGKKVEGGICTCCLGPVPHQEHNTIADDEDVLEEETNVKEMMQQGRIDPNVAVQIHGLAKMYPGRRQCSGCKCKRTSSYQALRGLWVAFSKDQLFCLLGPNGAGKTTTINCLTGITPVTGGDAIIYGNSIRSSVGMSNIRKMIGVCPQFDVLWDALNGQEHLYLFAMIKGLAPKTFGTVVQDSLAEVRLTDASKMRVSSYSGGMKRRLSVAIALIGDPKLIFLDEPTTGMDPISRRHVWDIIERAKTGRAIVLTTHSMEEADILSDRIGIMAKGRLRCIGTSIRLKSRFGTGFITNVSFSEISDGTHKQEAVKQFFDSRLNVKPKEENKAFLTFVIPNEKEEVLTSFFAELQDREEEFGITDIQLGLTTLEDVFLNIARQAELESALAEGRLVTLTLTTAGMSVQIPVGTRYVGIPETESAEHPRGIMVEVYWEQDDSGALCISGHSREIGIPAGVDLAPGTVIRSRGQPIGQRGLLNGVVIDPNQIPHGVSFS